MTALSTTKAGTSREPILTMFLLLRICLRGIQMNDSSSFMLNFTTGLRSRKTTKGRIISSGLGVDRRAGSTPRKRLLRRFIPVSSSVSLITLCCRFLSSGSRFPPGRPTCPDHGSARFSTRFTKRMRRSLFSGLRITATAVFASCSSLTGLSLFESCSIAVLSDNSFHSGVLKCGD